MEPAKTTEITKLTQRDFSIALSEGTCDVVDDMLAQGFVPIPDSIRIVCRKGNLELFHRLLSFPMNLQAGLFDAASYGQVHLLDHLYVAGVDINLQNQNGCTPLHYVKDVPIEQIQWLLDMGARQVVNRSGLTPLHYACIYGNLATVKLLLTHGGDQFVALPDGAGNTPLNLVCTDYYPGLFGEKIQEKQEIVQLLLQYEQVVKTMDLANFYGQTPLHAACNNLTLAKLLLDHYDNLDILLATDKNGKTPVYRACSYGNSEVLALLLSYPQGAQTAGQANKDGTTPLHHACSVGNVQMIELLLAHPEGVRSLNKLDENGKTPLDKAPHLSDLIAVHVARYTDTLN